MDQPVESEPVDSEHAAALVVEAAAADILSRLASLEEMLLALTESLLCSAAGGPPAGSDGEYGEY